MDTCYDKYVGAVLDGRYKIERVIGMGGMAVVFKAIDSKTGTYVAVKLLREDIAQEEESVKRFINESKAVAMLSHPNIVKIFAVSMKEDLKYIVMEYIEGITLKSYMQKKRILSPEETLSSAAQILAALDHAHSKGIVHRDIKPQNIMLTRSGQIKVTDFGIAKLPNAETVTMTDKAIGTVYYISPEQASGKAIDARSDLYSLGVTMYEMATGELPFNAESPVSVALMQVNEKQVPPKEVNPDIPLGLQQIINSAMEKDPGERYQSAKAMLADVTALRKNPKATFRNENKKAEKTGFRGVLAHMAHSNTMLPVILGVTIPFIIILIVSALIGISKITDVETKTETITVDDFVGENYYNNEKLRNALKNSEVYRVEIKAKDDDEHEPGVILEQSPKAGSKKKIERGVTYCELTLIVAASGEIPTIPVLKSLERRDAELKLKSLSIAYDVEVISSDIFEAGQVIKTEPAAGEKLAEGERLVVYVSSGPEEGDIEVPRLVGLKEREALSALQDKGLAIGKASYEKSDKEVGTVIRQKLPEGTRVAKNTRIDIVISGGKDYDPEKGVTTESETTKETETTKTPETTKETEPPVTEPDVTESETEPDTEPEITESDTEPDVTPPDKGGEGGEQNE